MRVELVRENRDRLRPGREIVSYGIIELPSDVGAPTVILWQDKTFVQGIIGGEVLYFEANVWDATGAQIKLSD